MAQITLNSTGVASSGALALQSNGTTTAVTIDASQNVGIGVTPSAWASGNKFIDVNASASYGAFGSSDSMMLANAYWNGSNWIRKNANNAWRMVMESTSGGPSWTFQYAGNSTAGSTISWSEAMRIDTSGNLLVGGTTSGGWSGDGRVVGVKNDGAGWGGSFYKTATTSVSGGGVLVRVDNTSSILTAFYYSTTNVGNITTNGTTTTYGTLSDYRLKENVQPMTGALSVVQQLKPCTYTWKADGSDGQGFIAHELQAVVPDCVVGQKDAVETYTDEDGVEQTRIKPQGIDTSFLVATLTAALQEAHGLIKDLQVRVNALEAK